jgi:hypothetical protein
MLKVIFLIILFYLTLILLMIYVHKFVIKKAINRFIRPDLQAKGLAFVEYKWLGFFNRGDFKNDAFVLIPSLTFGYPVTSIYIDVFYSNGPKKERMTVRIDSSLLFIRKVLYSHGF